jgi:hypothetical protein
MLKMDEAMKRRKKNLLINEEAKMQVNRERKKAKILF